MSSALPAHWPKRYNGSNEPCDILDGPCACGAWHTREEWRSYGYPAEFGWTVGTWEWYTDTLDLWLACQRMPSHERLREYYEQSDKSWLPEWLAEEWDDDLGTVHPET